MLTINPSLFAALGQGYRDDAYAQDGNHLRWQFDPRLGFPRLAFCVASRPSVTDGRTGEGEGGRIVDVRLDAGRPPQAWSEQSFPGFVARRDVSVAEQSTVGIALASDPLVIELDGPDGHACWARLRLRVDVRDALVQVEALYRNRGADEVVDVAVFSNRRFPFPRDGIDFDDLAPIRDRLAILLERPEVLSGVEAIDDQRLNALRTRLAKYDPRLARASRRWLDELVGGLDALGVDPATIGSDLSVSTPIDLQVRGPRIDALRITGRRSRLEVIEWVRAEDYAESGKWRDVGCFPAATFQADYGARNVDAFGGEDPGDLAVQRTIKARTRGVEPLDEPEVPPTREPTDAEKERRYFTPWSERLEPLLSRVLDESLGSGLHQSEVVIEEMLVDAGQQLGAGVPSALGTPTMQVHPYPLVLAAGMVAFPTARLLGLGCALPDVPDDLLDYRVTGQWLVDDLLSWVGATQRRAQALLDLIGDASPFDLLTDLPELIAAHQEVLETASFVADLVAAAVDGVVTLHTLVIGVQPGARPLFVEPASVAVAPDGLGLPGSHGHQAVALVSWALRQRARVADDTAVPTAACIGRGPDGSTGRFDEVRNPVDPADPGSPPVAILPAGPAGAPGAAGTAAFADRYVDDGVTYRYGVSECDPFNRWSPFGETAFRWDDLTAPAPPTQVQAELDEGGTPPRQTLTVRFVWPHDAAAPVPATMELHLRRSAPGSAAPGDRAQWGTFARQPGGGAGAILFDAANPPASLAHDGMDVAVSFVDEDRSGLLVRAFEVAVVGVVVPYDAGDRAVAWVAVGSINGKGIPSVDLGGPGLAEDFRIAPPPPPTFPPEPLLATYPDADRRSTFRLSWSSGASTRWTVYRAGEHELVAMASARSVATTYDEGASAAVRAAALKAIAPQLRDAFEPRTELLPPGSSTYEDELNGALQSLVLYTVVGASPALVPGSWPGTTSGFTAVAVPQIPEPNRPVVLHAGFPTDDDLGVELRVAAPPAGSAKVGTYEVARVFADRAELAGDWRRMRPLSPVPVPDPAPEVVTIRDAEALRPWTAYLYRVVARAAGPAPTRSQPSAPVRVVTVDRQPPGAPASVVLTTAGDNVTVTFRGAYPDNPVGPFRVELVDPAAQVTLHRTTASSARSAMDPAAFAVTAAHLAAASVVVRIIDPLGRPVSSPPEPRT